MDRLVANKFYHSSSPPKYKMTTVEEQQHILSIVDQMVPRSKIMNKPDSKGGRTSNRFDSKEQSTEKPLSQGSETRNRLEDQLMVQGTFKTFHIQTKKPSRKGRSKGADS